MNCPVCHDQLAKDGAEAFRCPAGHGVLVTAKLLRGDAPAAEQATIKAEALAASAPGRHEVITCPHCGAAMAATDYCYSGVTIDSCLACPYRWLDAGELSKIRNRTADVSRVSPKALVAISGFNMAEANQARTSAVQAQAEEYDDRNWTPPHLRQGRLLPRQFFSRPDAARLVGVGMAVFVGVFALIIWITVTSFPQQDTAAPTPVVQIPNTPYIPAPRTNDSNLPIGILVVAGFGGYFLLRRWLRNRTNDSAGPEATAGSSLILAMYTLGIHLQKMAEGDIAGYPYSFLITSEIVLPEMAETGGVESAPIGKPMKVQTLPDGMVRSPAGQSILVVNLPTVSEAHFAGFSLQDDVFRSLLGNTNLDNMMTRVELEGDFPDYFRLYCDKGKEIELLQVLDPDKMAFLVDFCKVCNWELVGGTLYFVQSGSVHDSSDNGDKTLVGNALEFAEKILPTLQGMSRAG